MLNQSFGWFLKLAIARLRVQWRAILTIIIGVLLTTLIGASAPLYTSAIAQVGLEQRLSQHPHEAVNIFMRLGARADVDDFPSHRQGYDQTISDTVAQTLNPFGNWHHQTITWAESVTLNVMQDDQDLPNVMFRLAHYDDLPEYAELIAGTWMTDEPIAGVDAEIALSEQIADVLGLNVGDVIVLEQRGWDSSLPITAQISAIFAPNDPLENYWMSPSPIRIERRGAEIQANMFITRGAFDQIIPAFIPQTRAQIGWRVLFAHHRLYYDHITDARTAIGQLQNNVRSALEAHTGERAQVVYETDLASALGDYGGEVEQLGAPFTLFLTQLGALVLFFLVVMGELVRRNERREIGMLKARGVRDSQLLLLRGMETFIICLIAVLVAPFIARQLLIGLTPLFTSVESIPLEIRLDSFLYAGVAGFVALVVLVGTLIPVLRTPLILASGMAERTQGAAWWQRYYLDVILLIVGVIAFAQMSSQQSATSANTLMLSDPLILLMPTLLIFAIGSISLRLFPPSVNLMARILGRRSSLAGALAGWQVSREPSHYGRMTFLLALAISMGWFALSFQRTVTVNRSDRALYYVGSDLRLDYRGTGIETTVSALDGVQSVANIIRYADISTTRGVLNLNRVNLLAVDQQTFHDAIYWRPEWGNITLNHTQTGASVIGDPLPFVPDKIELSGLAHILTYITLSETVLVTNIRPETAITITLMMNDDAGQLFTVPMTVPDPAVHIFYDADGQIIDPMVASQAPVSVEITHDGWNRYEADLTEIKDDVQGTLRLHSLRIDAGQGVHAHIREPRSLYLRDLTLVRDDETVALDWFKSADWDFVRIRDIDPYAPIPDEDTDAQYLEDSLTLYWMPTTVQSTFALTLNYNSPTTITLQGEGQPNDGDIVGIPALISHSMARQRNITVGQNFDMLFSAYGVWFQAVGIIDYFPTLYGDTAPFVVVNADALNDVLTYIHGGTPAESPQELWVRADSSANLEPILNDLALKTDEGFVITDTLRSDTMQNTFQADLLAVGLIGLLIFSAIIGFLLSLVGLLTYASLSVQARRTEFAVLRAMGFGTRRIILSMAIEQLFVIMIAMVLGMMIGLFLSTQVLPILSVDTTGHRLVPPFHVQVDPALLTFYMGGILLILLIQLVISSIFVSRLTTTQALRQPSE